jgi:hypothetical protein
VEPEDAFGEQARRRDFTKILNAQEAIMENIEYIMYGVDPSN